jgi:hypothetical protein
MSKSESPNSVKFETVQTGIPRDESRSSIQLIPPMDPTKMQGIFLASASSAMDEHLITCPVPMSGEASARNTSLIEAKGMLSHAGLGTNR